VAECVLYSIREVPGTNIFYQETGYPDGFRPFPQSLQANSGIVP
jgi:hypothetical protein